MRDVTRRDSWKNKRIQHLSHEATEKPWGMLFAGIAGRRLTPKCL